MITNPNQIDALAALRGGCPSITAGHRARSAELEEVRALFGEIVGECCEEYSIDPWKFAVGRVRGHHGERGGAWSIKPQFFIPLKPKGNILDRFGFERHSLLAFWAARCKVIRLPWRRGPKIRDEVFLPDGTWGARRFSLGKPTDGRALWAYPYRYRLKSGEVQDRTATVYVYRQAWRYNWLRWGPLFEVEKRFIWVSFDEEIGEGAGSWNGGCVECFYEMLPEETPVHALRRMERQRLFL